MLLFVENKRIFAGLSVSRWGWLLHNAVHCGNEHVIKFGRDETQEHRQRYHCKSCGRYFDDLTGTIFEGHHLPLRSWILCLYFMGLNLSNTQIA